MAEYNIFNSQWTAQQIEASIGKNPIIDETNKHWMVWNVQTMQYDDTGIVAQGESGSGSGDMLEDIYDPTHEHKPVAFKSQIPNRNLLDNPWFTVNQRNANAPDASGYFVDRWIGGAGVTVDQSGSLIFSAASNYIIQRLEDKLKAMLVGKSLTVSILFSDGTVEAGDQVYTGNDGNQTYFFIGTYFQGVKQPNGDILFWCVNPTKQVKAVKLELGSVSTLANDAPPNYAEELAKCQRYYQRIIVPYLAASYESPAGYGIMLNTTVARISIPITVAMRATPTIDISVADTKYITVGTSHLAVSAVEVRYSMGNSVLLYCTVSGGTAYAPCVMAFATGTARDAVIAFSADL